MAYIRTISEDEAEGELWQLYDQVQKQRGRLSNVLRIQSLHPRALKAHLDLYMTLMYGKGPLPRYEREMLGVVVSAANGCDYCVVHHKDALAKYTETDEVDAIATDFRAAGLSAERLALADYAEGLTKAPAEGRRDAVGALRAAGFDDESILHATEIIGYFNFVNRMVHGLGVHLEDDPHQDFLY